MDKLAANLKKLREDRDFTILELSQRSGVAPMTICYIERGKTRSPRYSTVSKLADALALRSAEALVKGE